LSLRSAFYRATTRLREIRDRALYPEAPDAAGHWQRVAMNHAADARIEALDPTSRSAVEISGASHAGRSWKEYVTLDYPDFDICAPLTEERRFDVVICEQVLEHVEDPWAAAENLRGLCAPDGLVIVSTPFLIKVHELPELGMFDYWRFTPRGLRLLLERAGLEVESVGSWGNRQALVGNIRTWSARRPWHSLRNEPDVPLQVWAFARNRAG
jgi:SAM-dependent methyltransferase